jgi:hypothetical protein
VPKSFIRHTRPELAKRHCRRPSSRTEAITVRNEIEMEKNNKDQRSKMSKDVIE